MKKNRRTFFKMWIEIRKDLGGWKSSGAVLTQQQWNCGSLNFRSYNFYSAASHFLEAGIDSALCGPKR